MNIELQDIYSDYLISQGHDATATGLAAILDGAISHDQVSLFLRADDYTSKDLWSFIKPEIRQHEMSSQLEGCCCRMTRFQKKHIPMKMQLTVGITLMQSIAMLRQLTYFRVWYAMVILRYPLDMKL